MADKPVNINMKTLHTALQSGGRVTSTLLLSAASAPVVLGVDDPINVEGIKTLTVYAGPAAAAAEVSPAPDVTAGFVPLHDAAGAISVAANTCRILDVSGVAYIQFTTAVTVVLTS